MEETAPKKTPLDILKSFSPATGIGFALLVLFLVFCNIDAYAVRWWLMLPLAAAGSGLLFWRRQRAQGVEARLCAIGIGLFLALVVLRDIGLSRKLAGLLDKVNQYKSEVNQFTSEINRFFGR